MGADSSAGDTLSVTVEVSDTVATRAAFDPSVAPTTEDMRLYVMVTYLGSIVDEQIISDWDGSSTTYTFTLVTGAEGYAVSAWADFGDTYYTVTSGIGKAPYVGMVAAAVDGSDMKCDAYYAVEDLTSGEDVTLSLTRPFALLNIVTTDCDEENVYNAGLVPDSYTITGVMAPTGFNLVDGAADENSVEELLFAATCAESTTNATNNLSYDYIFVGNDKVVSKFTAEYFTADGSFITSYDFANIPVKENYITNITGNIITKEGDLEITVDQTWAGTIVDVISGLITIDGDTVFYITEDVLDTMYADGTSLYLPFTGQGSVKIMFDPESLAPTVDKIILDFTECEDGVDVEFESEQFAGMVYFGDYYGENYAAADGVSLGDLVVYIPNGSGTLCSGYSVNNLTVTTAPSTFTIESGATVEGDVDVLGGRTVVEGTVEGTIDVFNVSEVNVANETGYDVYSTEGVVNLYYSQAYGVSVGLNDIVEEYAGYDFSSFLDLDFALSYAAVAGMLDFNDTQVGYDIDHLRNIAFTLTSDGSDIATASLKEDLAFDAITMGDVEDTLNAAVDALADALNGEMDKLDGVIDSIDDSLPVELQNALIAAVDKLQASVEAYTVTIPDVTISGGTALIPVATVIPDGDNADVQDILDIIGTPEDSFAGLVSGDNELTLYALISLSTELSEAEANLAELQAEYDAMDQSDYSSYIAYLIAKGAFYAYITVAESAVGEIEDTLEKYGITDDMLTTIAGLGEYLEVATEILTEVNTVAEELRSYNPWEYSYGSASFADGIDGVKTVLTFEFADGKSLYIYSDESSSMEDLSL